MGDKEFMDRLRQVEGLNWLEFRYGFRSSTAWAPNRIRWFTKMGNPKIDPPLSTIPLIKKDPEKVSLNVVNPPSGIVCQGPKVSQQGLCRSILAC